MPTLREQEMDDNLTGIYDSVVCGNLSYKEFKDAILALIEEKTQEVK